MDRHRLHSCLAAIVLFAGTARLSAQQGKIVVANDEWTLSDTGFAQAPDTPQYVANVVDWLTGGGPSNLLAYSDNFGLTDNQLAQTMANLGHSWTVSTTITFDLPTLQTFDAVFLCGFAATGTVLTDYVRAGGNLYIAAGARGTGGDAFLWNGMLNYFGLGVAAKTNNRIGVLPVQVNHPLFHGVTGLYQNNGTDPVDRDASDCRQRILASEGGNDLYAAFNGSDDLEFHVHSGTYTAGDTIELTAGLGTAGAPLYLTVINVNGTNFFVNLLKDRFGADCRWDASFAIPSGVAGVSVTLITYGIGITGSLEISNPQVVQFQ